MSYVDACHNLPNNGGRVFRHAWTKPIVEWLWRHWGFPRLKLGHMLRMKFIHWSIKGSGIPYVGHEVGFAPEIMQVKEKFGGLRIYTSHSNDYLDGLIDGLENASYHICEECGRPGQTRPGGWILTLCDECHGKK